MTSAKREKQFYACIDNAPKMSAEDEAAINKGDTELKSATDSTAECQAKLKNPEVWPAN